MFARRSIRRAATGIAATGIALGFVLAPHAAFASGGHPGHGYGVCAHGLGKDKAAEGSRPADCETEPTVETTHAPGGATTAPAIAETPDPVPSAGPDLAAVPDVAAQTEVATVPVQRPQAVPTMSSLVSPSFLSETRVPADPALVTTVAVPTPSPQAVPSDAPLARPEVGSVVTHPVGPLDAPVFVDQREPGALSFESTGGPDEPLFVQRVEVPSVRAQGVPSVVPLARAEVGASVTQPLEPQDLPPLQTRGVPEPHAPTSVVPVHIVDPSVTSAAKADPQGPLVEVAALPDGASATPSSTVPVAERDRAVASAFTPPPAPRHHGHPSSPPAGATRLAHTGVGTWTWELLGIGMVGIGLGSLAIGATRFTSRASRRS